jgi:signal transduction histidine kinase
MNTVSNEGLADLPESRSRAAPIIERAPLPMVEVEGPDHRVCFVNPAFCRLVKRTREDLLGKHFKEIVSNGEVCGPLLDRVYQTGEYETKVVPDKEGVDAVYWVYAMWPALNAEAVAERVIIQMTQSLHFHQNAAAMNEALLLGAIHQHELREEAEKANARLLTEVAERKQVARSLAETKAELRVHADSLENTVTERTTQLRTSLGDLEAFSYSLVHDLRAPIRAIQGFTQMALDMPQGEVGPAAVALLNRVVKAAARMDSLIQDVLSLSQVIRVPITKEAVDVDLLVCELVKERPELSAPRANIKIESPLLPMCGHEAMLSQCVTNLLSNAVKFTRPGEVPVVRVWSEELETTPTTVRLWVEDRGIGMSPEAHKVIFEIFQRLHPAAQYEGSGIGLAIVRKAVERMGGSVGVESAPGQGSRFWLELPKA